MKSLITERLVESREDMHIREIQRSPYCNFAFQVSATSQFEYSWCLVRSRYPADIRKGIILLEDLFQVSDE